MIVYLDLLFLLNFFFDFLLLITVSVTLKRNVSLKRILLGSLFGSLSIFFLFFPCSNFVLFFLKLIEAMIMVGITFKIKDKAYFIQNLTYLYMTSTVLGGFLYFLKLSFQEEHDGLVFSYDKPYFYLFFLLFTPFILFLYRRQRKELRYYEMFYPVTVHFKNGKKLTLNAFLDTGNHLRDPVTKKYIILMDKERLKGIVSIRSPVYVPYHSLNHQGLMRCIPIDFIEFLGIQSKNYLIGLSEQDLLKNGVECVLNSYCLEEIK